MPNTLDPRERLIVALDLPTAASALDLVDRMEGRCLWYKVGLELYLASGPAIVEEVCKRGFKVFLDLKLHDIPNTVAGAVRSLASSGASLLTIHAVGGAVMLEAAAEAASLAPTGPRLLAVTVLTSMNAAGLVEIGVTRSPGEQVMSLGELAIAAGITGLVCSPLEIVALRAALGTDPLLVVPGIRPAGSAAGDQQRIATPASAVADGASLLVVGRPMVQAPSPIAAAEAILAEIASAGAMQTA
jgi:orotidine-5'-phosphate decarboxylase